MLTSQAITTVDENTNFENKSFLTVLNGHNGELIKIPKPIRFHTLNDFKNFILESFTNFIIDDHENIFLLTSFGIRLNFNIINETNEVFVFDKRLFNENQDLLDSYINQNKGNFNQLINDYNQLINDEYLLDTNNIKDMSLNLKRFNGWAKSLYNNCVKINELIQNYLKQINIMFKSLNIIFQFINNFVNEIEKDFSNYSNHIKLLNFKTLHKSWINYYSNLKKFPRIKLQNSDSPLILINFLDHDKLVSDAQYIKDNLPHILTKFDAMAAEINDMNHDKLSIDKQIESKRNQSIENFRSNNFNSLISEISSIISAINNDLSSLNSNSDTNNINEIYSRNQKFYNQLISISEKFNDNLIATENFRLGLMNNSFKIFNNISQLQMKLVSLKQDLKRLSTPNNNQDTLSFNTISKIKSCEDYLSLTIDLPLLFGLLMIEKRRQFEWYDFYSKGIINNLTDQLMTIINHERMFQKLWLKKFGNFLSLVNNDSIQYFKPLVPSLDITLINSHEARLIFKIINNIDIERQDLLGYIDHIDKFKFDYTEKFSNLLDKNFKDMVKSTNNLKKVTQLISNMSNFTTSNEDMNESKLKSFDINNDGFDNNLIKGLKSRIKKLEILLHQQQFKNLDNWPVTRSHEHNIIGTGGANILSSTPRSIKSPSPMAASVTPPRTNPTLLLPKRLPTSTTVSSPKPNKGSLDSSPAPLDASTTIDKHLDNLRLRKENKELLEESNRLRQKLMNDEALIKQLMKDKEDLKEERGQKDESLQDKTDEISKLSVDNNNKDENIKELSQSNSEKDDKIKQLTVSIDELNEKIEDLSNIKNDLISNMTSKESQYVNESNNYEDEIKLLKLKVEEITEDYENLMELTESNRKHSLLIDEMNDIIENYTYNIKELAYVSFKYFFEFCLVLESMGLLLIKEYDEGNEDERFKITRVKGLRSKKDDGDTSIIAEEKKPSTKVIEQIVLKADWINDLCKEESNYDITSMSTNAEKNDDNFDEDKANNDNVNDNGNDNDNDNDEGIFHKSYELINTYNDFFKGSDSKFDEFVQNIALEDNFFLNGISKRFKDVEGYAKKLTKENKSKNQEIIKLQTKFKNKISISSFQVDDLALFLPTRVEKPNDLTFEQRPWAAFNIGAPHYFLNLDNFTNIKDKEWIVAKICSIEEHKVTDNNVSDKIANPYQLSEGIIWYTVFAKPDVL